SRVVVRDRGGELVGDLVGVAFGHRLGREQVAVRHRIPPGCASRPGAKQGSGKGSRAGGAEANPAYPSWGDWPARSCSIRSSSRRAISCLALGSGSTRAAATRKGLAAPAAEALAAASAGVATHP